MNVCLVCHGRKHRTELVSKVFEFDDRYVLVEGVPATVCEQCGERTFSSDAVERTRQLVAEGGDPAKTLQLHVYDYA